MDIPYYLELQRRMFDIFRYVSCHEKNFGTHSVILESLLVDTCAFFDSLCQTLIREKSLATNKASGEFNFGDYRTILESAFALSTKEVNLNPYDDALYSNPIHYAPDKITGYRIRPFEQWATGTASPWWGAFTGLKHDRLTNFHDANLGNAIYALAAVFIVLTIRNEPDFKEGSVSLELYNLFFPKYWTWKGRVSVSNFTWS